MTALPRMLSIPQTLETLGRATKSVSEVFVPNATARQAGEFAAWQAALAQHGQEFALQPIGWFDRFVNGVNRLPRPLLALGTLGLFVYAMVSPLSFATRMEGLALVPDPLWWLLGAIVGFYFGARELHHRRSSHPRRLPEPILSSWEPPAAPAAPEPTPVPTIEPAPDVDRDAGPGAGPGANAALDEWRARRALTGM